MKTIYGISILTGTIIGVGLFSLPYIASVVGIKLMVGYFLFLGIVSLLVHYFLAEICLETPDFLRLPGFAKHHLGKKAQTVAYISGIFGLIGALLAYLILGGEFLTALFSSYFGGGVMIYTIIYFIFFALFIYFGISAISKMELGGIILFVVFLVLTFLKGFGEITMENIFFFNEESFDFFLPYGAVLFALWGASLIPEIEETLNLGKERKKLLTIVPVGVIFSSIISFFFIILVLGVTGRETTKDALLGLGSHFQNGIATLIIVFGLVVIFTSLITVGLTVKKILWYDLKISEKTSWAITCFAPLILFLLGIKDFITVIGLVGGVMIAVDAILILLMYEKIKSKKVIFITYPLIFIFVLGIIYEIIYFLK
jgi:tyrosine-specific transport protein